MSVARQALRPNGRGLLVALAMVLTTCGYELHDDVSSDGCPPGSAGCPCAEDCEDGLECVGGSCLPGSGGATSSSSSSSSPQTSDATPTTGQEITGAGVGTDGGETSAACVFVCEDDIPELPECDAFAQDCPEGQKCAPHDSDGDGAWDLHTCVDIVGDGQRGDPCWAEGGATGVDDCAEGVMCWNLNEEGVGTCVALCSGSDRMPVCAPLLTECVVSSEGIPNLCLPVCNPLLQDCVGSQVCIGDPNGPAFWCVLDASGGVAPEGTPCEFANTCNPGLMCVDPDVYPSPACQGAPGCCAPFCDLTDMVACAGLSVEGAACAAYHEPGEAPPGLEHVGLCEVTP